jgi:palmitoyltransferase
MALVVINIILVIISLNCWYLVENINPEAGVVNDKYDKYHYIMPCFQPAIDKKARYCLTCRKKVLGLDHHCTWLNTCMYLII